MINKKVNKSFPRSDKVAVAVRQFVAEIIRDIHPELDITITDAESHGGLQFVRIFYQGKRQDFSKIKSQIRYELAQRMNQKYVPEIEFAYDETLEKANRIESLLKDI